jgi:GTPase involved in cell partitioning and DNA repair
MHWLRFVCPLVFHHHHHPSLCSSLSLVFLTAASSSREQGPLIMNHKHRPKIVTWLIDGNNLKCFRGVPDDRDSLIQELQRIASTKTDEQRDSIIIGSNNNNEDEDEGEAADVVPSISNVVLVFDGDQDETFSKHVSKCSWFQHVITDGRDKHKDRADNYMIDEALPKDLKSLQGKVHLVTADKELGKRARATRIMKGGSVVPPSKFWKQYLPNLQKRNND